MKPRNPFTEAARLRRGGAMRDRRATRGGARNRQVDLLAGADEEWGPRGGDVVAITGNRRIAKADREAVRNEIRRLVADPDVGTILFGGAVGADTEALAAARALRSGGRPALVVVVPDTLDAQPRAARQVAASADSIVELGSPIRPGDRWGAYHRRNRWMVDRATRLIAFWNGRTRSGTGATVAYARRVGVPVEIVDVEGDD